MDEFLIKCFLFRFREICFEGNSTKALKYLQVQLAQVVDHSNKDESLEFRGLSTNLFNKNKGSCYYLLINLHPVIIY